MSAAFVVDASVAVKWLFEEPDSGLARGVRKLRLLAPDLLLLECCSVVRRNLASGLPPRRVPEMLALLRSVPFELTRSSRFLDETMRYATLHPVYDCAYLALAVSTDLRVVTADRRFVRAVRADAVLGRHIHAACGVGALRSTTARWTPPPPEE